MIKLFSSEAAYIKGRKFNLRFKLMYKLIKQKILKLHAQVITE